MITRIESDGGKRFLGSLVRGMTPLRWPVIRQQNQNTAHKMQSKRQWASAVQVLDPRRYV